MAREISRRDFLKLTGITSGGLALTACGLDPTKFPDPTATTAAEALPTGEPPEFPIPLEVISTTEPIPGHPSVVDGLNIGEVTPNNVVGMIPGYESTGINTLYNPNDSSMLITKQNGEQVEAIPPRAFGIDQDQLIQYFNAKEVEGGEIMGDYQGASLTLKNGIWKAATGETFIPFIKAEPNTDAIYLVMDANGGIQKVDITGKAVGSPMPMFETPQAIAARMGFEKADQVVDVEMSKNGSLSFITKEPRPTEDKPDRTVQIVNEVAFLGEPEDLTKNAVVLNSADRIAQEMVKKGKVITKEELMKNGAEVKRIVGVDKNGKQKNYDVVTIKTDGETAEYPLAILNRENGLPEKVDMNKIFDMLGMDYVITAAWDEDNKAAWDEWLKEGDVIMPDSADTQKSMDQYGYSDSAEHLTDEQGLESLNSYLRRTMKNGQGFKMNHVFFGGDVIAKSIRGETDPGKVEAFMRERLATLIRLKPTEMNIVTEAFDFVDGKYIWEESPWYTVYGEEWPVKAFQFAEEEIKKQQLTPGKDIKLYWNDWKLDQPSGQLDKTLEIIGKIIENGSHIDGVGLQILTGENVKWYPHIPKKDEMVMVMQSILKYVQSISIDYETYHNPASSTKINPVAIEIIKACMEINRESPKAVTSFNIWDDYNPDSLLDPTSFAFYNKITYSPNENYYALQAQIIDEMV